MTPEQRRADAIRVAVAAAPPIPEEVMDRLIRMLYPELFR